MHSCCLNGCELSSLVAVNNGDHSHSLLCAAASLPCTQALPQALKLSPGGLQIDVYLHLCRAYTARGAMEDALKVAEAALSLARHAGDRLHLAAAYHTMAATRLLIEVTAMLECV